MLYTWKYNYIVIPASLDKHSACASSAFLKRVFPSFGLTASTTRSPTVLG